MKRGDQSTSSIDVWHSALSKLRLFAVSFPQCKPSGKQPHSCDTRIMQGTKEKIWQAVIILHNRKAPTSQAFTWHNYMYCEFACTAWKLLSTSVSVISRPFRHHKHALFILTVQRENTALLFCNFNCRWHAAINRRFINPIQVKQS